MKKLIFILLALCIIGGVGYSQVPVKRKKKDKTEQPQSSDNKRKQEAEAKRKREIEEQRQREAEAKRKQEEEARQQREAEAKRKQEEEARQQREAEAKRKQEEEARLQREAEAKRNETGMINGHEWVDLGLPSELKWATCNVGASSSSDYGNYYAWGETTSKSSYMGDNSLTHGKSMSELRSAGIIGTSGTLTMAHDAARANWGGSWRMPTRKELDELTDKCTWTWTSQGGHNGYKVTGPNGRSIFVPAAGRRYGTTLGNADKYGLYWSSTPYEENTSYAYNLRFYSGRRYVDSGCRFNGVSVRPVSK